MYSVLLPARNKNRDNEKSVNPRSMSITPSQIASLTSDGQSISMHALDGSLYYPNCGDGVMPLEFQRGIDINDCWEASQQSEEKLNEYKRHQARVAKTNQSDGSN